MLKEIPIADNIYWIGVNDRETALFESMWPLPRGVAYNSYLMVDEKVAVIEPSNIKDYVWGKPTIICSEIKEPNKAN